jgi:site-specific recombinase XerD
MGSVYKRGNIWYIDYRANGKRLRRRIGKSKRLAELALKDAEVKTERGELGFEIKRINIDAFLKQVTEYSTTNHSPNTIKRYSAVIAHFKAFLKDHRGIVRLSQIDSRLIDQYKTWRKEAVVSPSGKVVKLDGSESKYSRVGAKSHTINFEIGALRMFFNLAIRWGYMKENPTKDVARLKVKDSAKQRFLSKAECTKLINASPEPLKSIFMLFLNTGMRKAELENLQWSDIDFKRKKIKIQRKEFWNPKTGEREIPMSDKVYKLLNSIKRKSKSPSKDDLVFSSKKGGKLHTNFLREQLIPIAEKAGIDNMTKIHSLRHTFASHLVMQGIDLPTVQKLLGHADIQTTMIYAHLAPDHISSAVNSIDL